MDTPVLFRTKEGGIAAVFPCAPGSDTDNGDMACYAHVGQHGTCDLGWYATTRIATPAQYASLKRELESEYGYRLKVYRRMTPQHRAARRDEADRLRKLRESAL